MLNIETRELYCFTTGTQPFAGAIPKYAADRYSGEGDRCLRDRDKRICAWNVGYSDEDWEDLKANHPDWHESVGYYDEKECIVR